jgi:hypothetical protein
MTEENITESAEAAEETTPEATGDIKFQEVVEVPWEELQEALGLKSALGQAENQVALFLLNAEKRRALYMTRLAELENSLYESATRLQETKSLNPDWAYELKLPEEQGEKGYFIRKQDQ